MVITVFSASNYYDEGSNRGAYLRLSPDLSPSFVQYQVGRTTRKLTLRQRVSAVEQSALVSLQEKLFAHQSQLMAAFKRLDCDRTGLVLVSDWAQILEAELQLGLPWLSLRQQLTSATTTTTTSATTTSATITYSTCNTAPVPDGYVAYASCFPEGTGQMQLYEGVHPRLIETIYRHHTSLDSIFHAIDQDHSGLISLEEFHQAWRLLSSHTLEGVASDEGDRLSLARSIDFNHDGSIDFNEFLEAFRLADRPR